MRSVLVALVAYTFDVCASAQDTGLVTRPSKNSVQETTAKLISAIDSGGTYKVFYQLDHAAIAEKEAGTKLPPSQLIMFGNPKRRCSAHKRAPTLALDLPNRALIWQDPDGKVWVTYNDVGSTFASHGLKRTPEQIKAIEARQSALFDKAVD